MEGRGRQMMKEAEEDEGSGGRGRQRMKEAEEGEGSGGQREAEDEGGRGG